ncbi:MAG: DMT family transporter [Cryobacterium sp.]|nr:DMT family transporter [Cryobacterium sp.]
MVAILALSASIVYGLGDFIGGTLSRSFRPVAVLLVGQIAAVAALIPLALAAPSWQLPIDAYLWPTIAGLANALAMALFYAALATGTMGVVAPISAASVVVPVLGGILSGETITGLVFAGVVLLILGTVLAARHKSISAAGRTSNRSILWAVLSALLFGIAVLSLAKGSMISVPVTLVVSGAVSLVCYLVACTALQASIRFRGRELTAAASTGVLGIGANWLLTTASSFGQIAIVAVLASLYPAVTALMARWIHHERLSRSQLAGAIIILVGVIVVVLTQSGEL